MDLEDWEGEGGLSWTGLDCVRLDYIVSYRIVAYSVGFGGSGGWWGVAYLLTCLFVCLFVWLFGYLFVCRLAFVDYI